MKPRRIGLAAVVVALALPATALADVDVAITTIGYDPAEITVDAGEAIHWTNTTALPHAVTSTRGLFDSGVVPPGGGYTMALSTPGVHEYGSVAEAGFSGTIRVIATALPGGGADLAVGRIPDLPFPRADENEIDVHPQWGVEGSTVRVLLAIRPDAAVAEVNDALAAVDAEVVGGLPELRMILIEVPEEPTWAQGQVEVEDLGRFTGVTAALESLRGTRPFELAALSTAVAATALPRRPDAGLEAALPTWRWDQAGGANWGLKDARFPPAWNLRESIAATDPEIMTGIVDGGFYAHDDLTGVLNTLEQVCPPAVACTRMPNNGNEKFRTHGTLVAGVIGALWDNPATPEPPAAARSKGVSGGNPFARMIAVSFASTPLFDQTVQGFAMFLRARPQGLRVINFSATQDPPTPAALAAEFPNPTCGPGPIDDDLPDVAGTKFFCFPSTLDRWRRQAAAVGGAARIVAQEAAAADVLIVAASGNDSDVYCTPWGAPECVDRPVLAEHVSQFAWASKHWPEDEPNPILIVEAIDKDSKLAAFSNPGGDIAAPGVDVGSTGKPPGYKTASGTSFAAPHVTAAIGYLLADDPTLDMEELRRRLLDWGRQPPVFAAPPDHLFEWNVPDRFGHDDDANGRVDYGSVSGSAIPESFPIDLQACGSPVNGKPALAYRWTLNSETIEQSGCTLRYHFPAEGNYDVKLELLGEDGATATETRVVTVDDVVVAALGDGLASGEGAPDTSGATPFLNPRWQYATCHRSARAGGAQAARLLEVEDIRSSVTLVHLACAGARIQGDRDSGGNYLPLPDGNGGLLSPYTPPIGPDERPQLDELPTSAGGRKVDAVVLSAGAEDLRLADILLTCLQPGDTCHEGAGAAILAQRLPTLAARLDAVAAGLGAQAIPASHVFVTEYADFTRNELAAPDLACVGIGDDEAAWLSNTVRVELNAAIELAAARAGWTLVPLGNAFAEHGACATFPFFPTQSSSGGIAPGSPQLLGLYHPNAEGHSAYATRIADAIRDKLALPPVNARRPIADSSPRLDLYPALLSDPDAAKRLVDVNDVSKDGNRRVIHSATSQTDDTRFSYVAGAKTARDGDVDLSDFRRFRDAWLAECVDRPRDAACPAADQIHLDGAPGHVKKDGNFDGCVRSSGDPAGCRAWEGDFSRFDFNGGGTVSVESKSLLPLKEDGTVAATRLEGTQLTDFDLLRSQWSPGASGSEGWNADELETLLRSADLEVHTDALFDSTARKARIEVRTPGGDPIGPARTLKRGDGFVVVTVPVGTPDDRFEVVGHTTEGGRSKRFSSDPFSLRFGEDKRIDLCEGATLTASEPRLPADGTSAADLTLAVSACGGDASGREVAWELEPATGGAVLEPGGDTTDGAGKATARLVAGTERETYTVRATVDGASGRTDVAELQIEVIPKVTIRYLWRQTIEQWSEEGTTRWPDPTPLQPDCFLANLNYCIEDFSIGLLPDTATELQRAGTLTGGGKKVELTEAVLDGGTESLSSWKLTKPDGEEIETGSEINQWTVTDPGAYTNHELEKVEISDEVDGIHLDGFQEVGSLPYHYSLVVTESTGQRDPEELHATRTEFLLVPQGDRPPLNFAAQPEAGIVFNRTDEGFQQYQSCGLYSDDFELEPGYLVREDSEFLPGAASLKRKPDYVAGDRPMPVGAGNVRIRYSFAATIAYEGDVPAEPELPTCDENHPPEAEFRWTPDEVDEGRVVRFFDQTKDVDQDVESWEWQTSDGQSATGPRPHFLFKDDGVVKVTLTVTDSLGETDTVEHELTVANLPPEASIDDAVAQQGTVAIVDYRALDPGFADNLQLHVRITSTNPNWVTIDRVEKGDVHPMEISGAPVGEYPLTLTVIDKDGESAEDTATLSVIAGTPPPPPDDDTSGAFPTVCEPETALDPEEQAFLGFVNEYRADNGLGPVGVSATLTRAAERHAHDMAVFDFMDHFGSDGSDPHDRAVDAGYPENEAASENLAEGRIAFDVLWAWRSSDHGHNENMLDPAWKTIGIAREKGSIWRWATSYGAKQDCNGVPASTPAPPEGEAASAAQPRTLTASSLLLGPATNAEPANDSGSTAGPPPTAAFTISHLRPRVGTQVVLTNRSRDDAGNPVGATIEPAPGVLVSLGPDVSTTYTYSNAGPVAVSVHATSDTASSSATRTIEVRPKGLVNLAYLGDTTGVVGRSLLVSVRADDTTDAQPAAGIDVTFTLEGRSVTATTGDTGRAGGQIDLTGLTPGQRFLSVQFAGNASYAAASTFAWIDVVVNRAPVADPGGPYVLGEGQTLILDGSRSTDPDTGDRVARWEWDLNGDGDFGGFLEPKVQHPPDLPWSEVVTRVCGGSCALGVDYTIGLRVTDTRGDQATATTTATFTADFAVFLASGPKVVVPGASNSYGVTVVASSTWAHAVTLAVEGLPAGVTGTFSKTSVTAPGTSVLTLAAGSSVPSGTFAFTVTGTSNGVVRSAGQELEVTFGLIPKCYGAYTGTVTDRDTGLPLEDATVRGPGTTAAVTGADGRYTLTNVELGFQNQPVTLLVRAQKASYWEASNLAEAACGLTTRVDLDLRLERKGRVTGLVLDKDTRQPISGATLAGGFPAPIFTTDADGRYAGELALSPDNAPKFYSYSAVAPEYWSQVRDFTATVDTEQRVDYELVRKCYGTLGGGEVLRASDGAPVRNARVLIQVGGTSHTRVTDEQGLFSFDLPLPLGHNNTGISYVISVQPPLDAPPGSTGSFKILQLTECGQQLSASLSINIPVPNYGALEGYVLDAETNQPLAGVAVSTAPPEPNGLGQLTTTDATGFYRFERVFIGFDAVKAAGKSTFGSRDDYWAGSGSPNVTANQTARFDLKLFRKRFGEVQGAVSDAVTGAPIPFANVGGITSTGSDGRYRADILLSPPNSPSTRLIRTEASGYWFQDKTATIAADTTTTTDFQLVRECATARIVGRVVNAETQAPISGAILLSNVGGFAITNALGRFELAGLRSGHNNVPSPLSVTASAAGFISQTKSVTVFCGATITLDFGNRSNATGTIVGTLTNLDTGQPIAGAFVGGDFGATATTDATGSYRFTDVPLNDLDVDREWNVTALPAGFKPRTQVAVARAGQETRVDFGFTKLGNAKPVANPQHLQVSEDPGSSWLKITTTGSDADADVLSFHVVRFPEHGRLHGVPPNVEYVPFTDYSGPDSFEFIAHDGQEGSERATVSIDVLPVNDNPRAFNDTFERPKGVPARIKIADILANDTDVDGDPLHIAILQPFFPAQAQIVGDEVVVTPTPTQTQAIVQYYASDPSGALGFARITIDFVTTPLAPVCADKTFDGTQDTPLSGQLSCTDGNGDALTYSVVAAPVGGTLVLAPSGSFTYTPPAGFSGTKTFTFKASDGGLESPVATATLVIAATNRAPVADDLTLETNEDVAIPLTLTGSDPDGDSLGFAVTTPPTHGTLSGTAPSLVYTPDANFHGPDSFTFRSSDGEVDSNLATVTLTVRPVNDPPVGVLDAYAANAGTELVVPAPGVLANDSDVDGDALTATLVLPPSHGSFDLQPDGSFTYTPDSSFGGLDGFSYRVFDGTAGSATVNVVLTVAPVNQPPLADDLAVATDEDVALPLTLTASDAEGGGLTFVVVSSPAHGTLSGTAPALVYTPAPNYHGPDSFTFRASDGELDSSLATVSLTVRPVDDAPVAADASAATDEETPLPLTLAGSDVEGDALTFAVVTGPAHGTLSGTAPDLVYTPALDYHGPDSFTFRASDGPLGSNLATVSLTVRPVNDAPVATGQSAATDEDVPLPLTLAGTDVDGDALTFAVVTGPAHGTLSGTAPDVVYTPAPGYHGADSLTFRASDGALGSNLATVSLTVRPANDPPVAADQSAATDEETPLPLTLAASDVDGDALTFAVVGAPTHGTLSGTAPDLVYTPAANYHGPDSFNFRARDGARDSNLATVSLTVRPVNDAPVAADVNATTSEDVPLSLTLVAADIDGDSLGFGVVTPPAHGTLSGAAPAFVYTPDAGFHGSDSFTFRASDGELDSNLATVTLTIRPVNDAPVATDRSASTDEDTPVALTLAGDDPDGDPITFAAASAPAHGTLSGTAPDLVYTPHANYHGPDSFTFRVSDGTLGSNAGTVSLTVRPVNDVPVALSQQLQTPAGEPLAVTLGGSDPDGEALAFFVATQPAHGVLSGTPPALTYTPEAAFSGADSFTFRATDGSASSAPATIAIDVAEPPAVDPANPLLVVDADSLDDGLQFNPAGGGIVSTGPSFFSRSDVSDDRAGVASRGALRYFQSHVGETITVQTGKTGDEGWFAPNCIPAKWLSGTSNTCLGAGVSRDKAIDNYFGLNGSGAIAPQAKLDNIAAVMPLRARGLLSLVGKTACAVVFDGDVGINYTSSTFPFTNANLQGATLGVVAFDVRAVRRLRGFSSSTLPEVQLTIRSTSACGIWTLFNAPVPRSSSVPNDVDPANLSGTGTNGYRALLARAGEQLFY